MEVRSMISQLAPQSRFVFNGIEYEVLNVFRSEGEIRYKKTTRAGEEPPFSSHLMTFPDFYEGVNSGSIELVVPRNEQHLLYLSKAELKTIAYRERYVLQAIKESPKAPTRPIGVEEAIKVVATEIGDSNPPCCSTVQGWIKRYRDNGETKHSLLHRASLSIPRKRNMLVEEAMHDCISDFLLCRKPMSIAQAYHHLKQRCEDIKIDNPEEGDFKTPCISTFRNRVRAYTDEEMLIAKYGKNRAKKEVRKKLKAFKVNGILERCEMDGLHIHLGIVDKDKPNVFLGTIVLMYVMDVYSRVILGYQIHLAKKKSETADLLISCLKHAFEVKDERWPIVNKIPLLVTDASAPATSESVVNFISERNINLVITKTGEPQEKPFIESLNNTIRRMFLRYLPGYQGREKFRGQNIKLADGVEKSAAMTLEQFVEEFERFVHEVYHKNPHSGLAGRAPIDVWNSEFENLPLRMRESIPVSTTPDLHGIEGNRKFHKKESGFFIRGRWYRDGSLHKWLISNSSNSMGYSEREVFENVTILYSLLDVRSVTVIHPKTMEPKKVHLSTLDTLNVDTSRPIQEEVYNQLISNPVMQIRKADKTYYEPSAGTTEQAERVQKQRKRDLKERKKSESERRTKRFAHHTIGSKGYLDDIQTLTEQGGVRTAIIHPSSQIESQEMNDDHNWEEDIDIDDIGQYEE